MKTKWCPDCQQQLDVKHFGSNKARPDGLQSHCRACKKTSQAAWYLKNKERHVKNVRLRNRRVREEVFKAIFDYLCQHPCIDCGEADPLVLEFDHVIGKKSFSIGDYAKKGYSISKVLKEIAKCEVRCANCHRRKTARAGGHRRYVYTSVA
jgi:hypothetical protein